MLQLILGRAASGKTETIHKLMSMEDPEKTVLIVPEQFTFETEKSLLNKGISNFDVLSFTRLTETTNNIYGGTAGDTLSGFDKVIIMLRALDNVKPVLNIYKNYFDSVEFATKLVSLNDEFKESAISLDKLKSSIESIKLSTTKLKIREIVEIFSEYNAIVENEFLDPADNLKRLYDVVNNNKFFKDKNVYLDGFKSFSNAQLKILQCILRDANKVIISFCCDPDDFNTKKIKLFHNVYEIINKIYLNADKYSCKILDPILLKESYFNNTELKFFEKNAFCKNGYKFDNYTNKVNIMHSVSPAEMIDNTLILIHRLVMNEGYKYDDFVIVARDINKYDRYLSAYSKKYNIPIYFDKRKSLKYSPISRFILNALNAAIHFKSDAILEYLKSGFNIVSAEEIALLEDYIFQWRIDGDTWREEWTMSVKGLDTYNDEEDKEKCNKQLARINDIRSKVIKPLITLKNNLSTNSTKNCEIVYNFIKQMNVSKLLTEYIDQLDEIKEYKEADYCRASFEPFIEVISSLHKCFKNCETTPAKFVEFLRHTIINKTVGSIPQMLDEVTCGSADRIRTARPNVAFIIGLNQYEFPAIISDNDLLLNSDRKELISCNIDIVDKLTTYMYNENFLLYSSTCCASERLFLCSCSNSGESTPSSIIATTKKIFPKCNVIDFSNPEDKIETKENAFSILAELEAKSFQNYDALKEYYNNTEYASKLKYLNSSLEINDAKLSDDFVDKFLNKNLKLSASKIESFYKCRFMYFCKSILYLSKKRVAEIDVMNRGTMVHYVLEQSIRKYGLKLSNLTQQELDNLVDLYLEEYLVKMDAIDMLNDTRFKYIFYKLATLTKKTIYRIADEFKTTEFKPTYCECKIDTKPDKTLEPLIINGKNDIIITGSIDRVDILESKQNNYVRIVDYKSGNMTINLNNVLYGLNLQMLVYLYAFIKNDKKYNSTPAGVFYLPVNGGYNAQNPKMKMNGIIPNDDFLYNALDSSGKYIPNKPTDLTRKENPQINISDFDVIFDFLNIKILEMESEILKGEFSVKPIKQGNKTACDYCDFKTICRFESGTYAGVDTSKNTVEVLECMRSIIDGI